MPQELKATLNLPKTEFSMKANLPQNEPKMLARWEQMKIYDLIRQARRGGDDPAKLARFCSRRSRATGIRSTPKASRNG